MVSYFEPNANAHWCSNAWSFSKWIPCKNNTVICHVRKDIQKSTFISNTWWIRIFILYEKIVFFPAVDIWWMIKTLVRWMFDQVNSLRCSEFVSPFPLYQTLMTISTFDSVAHNMWLILDVLPYKIHRIRWVQQLSITLKFKFAYLRTAPWKLELTNSLIWVNFAWNWESTAPMSILIKNKNDQRLKFHTFNNLLKLIFPRFDGNCNSIRKFIFQMLCTSQTFEFTVHHNR